MTTTSIVTLRIVSVAGFVNLSVASAKAARTIPRIDCEMTGRADKTDRADS